MLGATPDLPASDRGGTVTPARIPLDGGGSVLVETTAGIEGPVKAGRIGDAVREVPQTLQEALEPVTRVAQVALDQLRKARPDQITIEFGVDLAVEAGAVITKSRANCHPQVSASWQNDDG
ncbi:CU044_2847 family protein [Streptomyces lavendulae]|uniref:CU044_2847 family protein n=1 Tax=Streptomyces lavendulae TaxID=1914 RepID=UPI000690F5A3